MNMTTCIKCGAPIEDGELFCANCAQNGAAVQPRPAPLPAGRMQTPPRLKKQPAEWGGELRKHFSKERCSQTAMPFFAVFELYFGLFLSPVQNQMHR